MAEQLELSFRFRVARMRVVTPWSTGVHYVAQGGESTTLCGVTIDWKKIRPKAGDVICPECRRIARAMQAEVVG